MVCKDHDPPRALHLHPCKWLDFYMCLSGNVHHIALKPDHMRRGLLRRKKEAEDESNGCGLQKDLRSTLCVPCEFTHLRTAVLFFCAQNNIVHDVHRMRWLDVCVFSICSTPLSLSLHEHGYVAFAMRFRLLSSPQMIFRSLKTEHLENICLFDFIP